MAEAYVESYQALLENARSRINLRNGTRVKRERRLETYASMGAGIISPFGGRLTSKSRSSGFSATIVWLNAGTFQLDSTALICS
jgi:hypothetical protein